jgi:nickel transport protein
MNVKSLICSLILLLGLVVFPGKAFAHAVETDYRLVSDALEIQAIFSTGEFFHDADIVVYSPDDPTQPWLEGLTDQDGKFLFHPEESMFGEWAIEIGEGNHWDRLEIPVNDYGIDINAVSQLHEPIPHHHFPLGGQFFIASTSLCLGIVVRFLGRELSLRDFLS